MGKTGLSFITLLLDKHAINSVEALELFCKVSYLCKSNPDSIFLLYNIASRLKTSPYNRFL